MNKLIDIYKLFLDSTPKPKQRLPQVIQFPINNICDSRCQMCNIWQHKKEHEITPDEIRKILCNPLFREVRGVGINGGEPTLRKDIGKVVEAVVATLPRLKGICLITNALAHDRVINTIKNVGAVCNQNNINLDIMVSLDGIGEVHDRVRGRKGNFESAVKVIDFIQNSPLVTSSSIGCTVIKENVFTVENVLQWCENKKIYARFRLGIPHQRLYTKELKNPFRLSWEEKFHFANFLDHLYFHYEKNEFRRAFYRSLRDQIVYNLPRATGCDWKFKGVTLSPKGDLSYCAVESKTLGNALLEDSEELYWSNSHYLKQLIENKCATCKHDYSGIADRKVFLEHIKRILLKKIPKPVENQLIRVAKTIFANKGKRRIQNSLRILKGSSDKIQVGLPKRILICGWYGTETLGDKAILGGVLTAIRNTFYNYEVDVASIEPYITQMTSFQLPELKINQVLSLALAKKLVREGKYQCVVVAGGPLMSSIGECIDLLELFVLAKNIGAKTVIAGCGIGPLKATYRKKSIELLLRLADVTVLRDKSSLELAQKELSYTKTAYTTLDPAFVWIKKSQDFGRDRNNKQILLALRDWSIYEYALHMRLDQAKQIKLNFENELKKLVDELVYIDPSLNIIPFCMHKLAVGGDDRAFYRRIFSEYPNILKNLDNTHQNPHDDLKLISQSRVVLAMRFHSVVFSLATKTPFLAIDYTMGGKIYGLLKDLRIYNCMLGLKDFDGRVVAKKLLNQEVNVPMLDEEVTKTEQTLTNVFAKILGR